MVENRPQDIATTTLFTIGFTKKSAESFFGKLQNAGVSRFGMPLPAGRRNSRFELDGK
jgi:hypothetical protein